MTLEQEQTAETMMNKNAETAKRRGISEETRGFLYAIISSLCYTISLSSLRGITNYPEVSSDWSIAVKELVTVACITPFILVQWIRGKYKFPNLKTWGLIIFAGVVCQALGARNHLLAYAALGLALATPLIQASQLIMSSLIGAFWLKERVTKSKIVALVLLIVAVWLLSGGNTSLDMNVAGKPVRLGFGLLCAILTALGYSMQLSTMRKVLRQPKKDSNGAVSDFYAPTTLGMVIVTGVGALVCGGFLTANEGLDAWVAPPAPCWKFVITAGVANMIGFWFQIEGLRRLFVLKQTMIANAQTITLVLFGFLFFHEPFTWTIGIGAIMVALGVAIAGMDK